MHSVARDAGDSWDHPSPGSLVSQVPAENTERYVASAVTRTGSVQTRAPILRIIGAMKTSGAGGSDLLGSIARRAMLERGLLPDFSAAALKQSDAISGPAAAAGPAIRDLRALLWA